jgi:hypothetical protein
MTEILSIDGSKIDQVLIDIAKLILHLSRSSKKSKNDERLIKQITEIRNRIRDIVLQARLKKSKKLMFNQWVSALIGVILRFMFT